MSESGPSSTPDRVLTPRQAAQDPRPAGELTRVYGREEAFEGFRGGPAGDEAHFGARHQALAGQREA